MLLAGGVTAVLLLLFVVIAEAVGWILDRWRVRRYVGVLYDEPPRQWGLYAKVRERSFERSLPEARRPPDVDGEGQECVFQYMDCAFTEFTPQLGQSDDDEPEAYRLARLEGPVALREYEARIWGEFRLDDPDERRRYREQVQLGRVLARAKHCLYCNAALRKSFTRELRFSERTFGWRYIVATCDVCGWWCVTHLIQEESWYFWSEAYRHAFAALKRYDPLAVETPLALARDYLARNPHKLARFDPFRFEDLMAECLTEVFGDGEVVKLGGRQDGGLDIKAIRSNGETTLVQVKRRADFSKKEGVVTVRELHGVMLREGVPRGMIITTAHDFSRAARDEVAQTRRTLHHYSMELLPLADVVSLLGVPAAPIKRPWEQHGIRLDEQVPGWPNGGRMWIDRSALPSGLSGLY